MGGSPSTPAVNVDTSKPCSLTIFKGGGHTDFNKTIYDSYMNPGQHGMRDNEISSYTVNGCDNTRIDMFDNFDHKTDQAVLNRIRGSQDMPGGWNDKVSSIKFTTIPSVIPGHLMYDNNTGCAGSGQSYEKSGGTVYRCFYSDTDQSQLNNLYEGKGTNSELIAMHSSLKTKFCAIPANAFKNPGGGKCLEFQGGADIAKQYCSTANHIVVDSSCTIANLGSTNYPLVADAYCKSAKGIADPWCSCYNVKNKVCNTNSAAAGCEKKRQTFDKLVEASPVGFKNVWDGMETCFGLVCQEGAKYRPAGFNDFCNKPVQICVQSFDIQGIADSPINATCNLSSSNTPSVNNGTPPPGSPPGSPATGVSSFIPMSVTDLKTNRNSQIGVGGSLVCLCCCCMCIVLLLVMSGGDGGGGGPSRFRR